LADDNNNLPGTNIHSGVLVDTKVKTKKPSLYQVIIHNDDFTPMEFVVEVLEKFFNKNHAAATEIMLNVHHKGQGICGVFPYDIAETKVATVSDYARRAEHPLKCTMEKAP
jgi:ATP-dependent Clp protease adaptor protein ClpS